MQEDSGPQAQATAECDALLAALGALRQQLAAPVSADPEAETLQQRTDELAVLLGRAASWMDRVDDASRRRVAAQVALCGNELVRLGLRNRGAIETLLGESAPAAGRTGPGY